MQYYEYINEHTKRLTDILTEFFKPFGYTVREEYAELIAESPVTTPVLTVGMHSIITETDEFNQLLGNDLSTDLLTFGRAITVVYRVTVHSSAEHAYTVCRSAASVIADACGRTMDVIRVTSGLSRYDRQSRCVVMPVDVTVRYLIT